MRLGVFAKTFPGDDPASVLAAVAKAGFTAAQYNMACSGLPPMPEAISPEVVAKVVAASRDAGVSLVALSGTYNMIHPDPAVRRSGEERLATIAAAAAAMGAQLVTLCTGTRDPDDPWRAHRDNDAPEAWRDLLAAMEIALGAAEACDVDLGIEPELGNVINSAAKARRLIDEMKSRRVKIVIDPANLFEIATLTEQRHIVSAAIDLLADRIVMGHAKDRAGDGAFVAAGQGVLDYSHYLAGLKRIGFDGALVSHGLTAAQAPGVVAMLRRVCGDAGVEITR